MELSAAALKILLIAIIEVMGMDIMGSLALTARGYKHMYIQVVGDYFSKWVEMIPLPDIGTGGFCSKRWQILLEKQ